MASTVGSRPSRATAVSQGSPRVPATLLMGHFRWQVEPRAALPGLVTLSPTGWIPTRPTPSLLFSHLPVSTFIYLYLKRHFFK